MNCRQRGWRASLPLIAAGAMLHIGGCGYGKQSILAPAGPVAKAQLGMFTESLAIMSGIFIVVAGVFVYSVIRFRARRDQVDLPPEIHGNTRLEIFWTIVPIILLFFLAVPTVHYAYALETPPQGRNVLQVEVIGHQFWWQFRYPGTRVDTANVLHIPTGTKVNLALRSADVIHSFWVPRLGGKTDLIPGRTNYLWLEASQAGTYSGQCAQLCGAGHAFMKFTVVAESPSAFRSWLRGMEHPKAQALDPEQQAGLRLFAADCATCHAVAGTPFHGQVGPNLTGLMQRPTIAAGTLPNNAADLARWIADPPLVKPGAKMPVLGLPPTQIRALVAYLQSLN